MSVSYHHLAARFRTYPRSTRFAILLEAILLVAYIGLLLALLISQTPFAPGGDPGGFTAFFSMVCVGMAAASYYMLRRLSQGTHATFRGVRALMLCRILVLLGVNLLMVQSSAVVVLIWALITELFTLRRVPAHPTAT